MRLLYPDKTLHKGDILVKTKVKFSEEIQSKLALEDLDYTNESLKKSYNSFYNLYAKRVIDFCLALVALLVAWPFMLIIAVAVAADTGFPVFYKPLRGGYKNKSFKIFKFRTMVKDAEKIGSGTTALNDSRIT